MTVNIDNLAPLLAPKATVRCFTETQAKQSQDVCTRGIGVVAGTLTENGAVQSDIPKASDRVLTTNREERSTPQHFSFLAEKRDELFLEAYSFLVEIPNLSDQRIG